MLRPRKTFQLANPTYLPNLGLEVCTKERRDTISKPCNPNPRDPGFGEIRGFIGFRGLGFPKTRVFRV